MQWNADSDICWWDQVWSLLLFLYLVFSVVKTPRWPQFHICDGQRWPLKGELMGLHIIPAFFLEKHKPEVEYSFFFSRYRRRSDFSVTKAIYGSQEQFTVDYKVFPKTRKVSASPVIIINNHKIVSWHEVLDYFQVQRPKPDLYWKHNRKHNQKHYSQPGRILQVGKLWDSLINPHASYMKY